MSEHARSMAPQIAGALFDFLGFLTTRDRPLTLSSRHHAPPAVEALREWAGKRGLDLDGADVMHWHEHLASDGAGLRPNSERSVIGGDWIADGDEGHHRVR